MHATRKPLACRYIAMNFTKRSGVVLLMFAATLCVSFPRSAPADVAFGQAVTQIDGRIWNIYQSHSGDIWFGSNGRGAYRFDGDIVTHYNHDDGLEGLHVRDIQDDQSGGVLISTNSGVFRFDGDVINPVETVFATTSEDGWRLDENDTWIAYRPGEYGPSRYDGERLHVLQLPTSPYEDAFRARYPRAAFEPTGIYSIYKDRRGDLWFGTASVGLCRYDGRTLSWMYEEHLTTTPSGGAFGIRSIFEDHDGKFWICNTRHRYDFTQEPELDPPFSLLKYTEKQGFPGAAQDSDPNFVYHHAMVEDKSGALWVAGGSDGVFRYSADATTRYDLADGAYAIEALCDVDGTIWIGTLEHGVFVFENDRFHPFNIGM